jgi:transposase
MARRPVPIQVKAKDLAAIEEFLRGGVQPVRAVVRGLALRLLAGHATAPQVARAVPLTAKAIRELAHRYMEGGLELALYEKQRPGAKQILDASQKQRIIAMVCSDPPEGRARWTVRLVAQEAVKRKLVPRIGRETIRVLLESHDLKPWREKNVVHRGVERRLHSPDGRRTGGL